MRTKILELRDSATFIPVLCVDMNPSGGAAIEERWLLRRAGYSCDYEPIILLTRADGSGRACYDPFDWGDRTFSVAHQYIIAHWRSLDSGDVVDVEFILGERAEPKVSERLEGGGA
jgi:hypothetical protein